MVDIGAQVSLISSGLVTYLGLLDSEGAKMLPTNFTVSGYDGGSRARLPILEVWMRFGTRGDNIRWERVQLTVL